MDHNGGVFKISFAYASAGLVRAGRLQSGSTDRAEAEISGGSSFNRPQPPSTATGPTHTGTQGEEVCAQW